MIKRERIGMILDSLNVERKHRGKSQSRDETLTMSKMEKENSEREKGLEK